MIVLESETQFQKILSIAGASLGAYHGYIRNNESMGWAIGWAIFGRSLPVLAIPVMLAQGYAQPEHPPVAALSTPARKNPRTGKPRRFRRRR